jgi:hypothetical protein
VWLLPAYDAWCLLTGLEVLSDRRIFASALFVRDILVGRVDCVELALMLAFMLSGDLNGVMVGYADC